jgi:hypothetical protein
MDTLPDGIYKPLFLALGSAFIWIFGYFLKKLVEILNKLQTDVHEIKIKDAVQDEKIETQDERITELSKKLYFVQSGKSR